MRERACDRGYISISDGTHDRLHAYCEANGLSMAEVVESLVTLDQLIRLTRERAEKRQNGR